MGFGRSVSRPIETGIGRRGGWERELVDGAYRLGEDDRADHAGAGVAHLRGRDEVVRHFDDRMFGMTAWVFASRRTLFRFGLGFDLGLTCGIL